MTTISNTPARIDFTAWQGDTWTPCTITVTISSTPVNFTGWTCKMEIRNANSNAIAYTLTQADGITLGGALGTIVPTLTAAQTNTMLGEYRYDLEMTDPDGVKKTYIFGSITIESDTTQNT